MIRAGEHWVLGTVSRRSLPFLLLSGLATVVSWLAYFRALQMAPPWVAPIDKVNMLAVILTAVWFGEPPDLTGSRLGWVCRWRARIVSRFELAGGPWGLDVGRQWQ